MWSFESCYGTITKRANPTLFSPVYASTAMIYVADTFKQGRKYKYRIAELERLGPEIHTLTPLVNSGSLGGHPDNYWKFAFGTVITTFDLWHSIGCRNDVWRTLENTICCSQQARPRREQGSGKDSLYNMQICSKFSKRFYRLVLPY